MIINGIKIEDHFIFKGEFAADFCHGVNVLIGGNGTGKTTLIKAMYKYAKEITNIQAFYTKKDGFIDKEIKEELTEQFKNRYENKLNITIDDKEVSYATYIPEKDILEHASGLLSFILEEVTGFSKFYEDLLFFAEDLLFAARDVPTRNQSETQKSVGQKIAKLIDGVVHRDVDGSFYTLKTDGTRIPFENEASGYKRIGFLGLLVSRGRLEPGSILFWDEPENSLNPELVPDLVDILLELSRSGVQIFMATHDYLLPKYLEVRRKTEDEVWFHFLSKTGFNQPVTIESDTFFSAFENNNIINQPIRLYEETHKEGMG